MVRSSTEFEKAVHFLPSEDGVTEGEELCGANGSASDRPPPDISIVDLSEVREPGRAGVEVVTTGLGGVERVGVTTTTVGAGLGTGFSITAGDVMVLEAAVVVVVVDEEVNSIEGVRVACVGRTSLEDRPGEEEDTFTETDEIVGTGDVTVSMTDVLAELLTPLVAAGSGSSIGFDCTINGSFCVRGWLWLILFR